MFNHIPLGGLLTVGNVVKVLEKRFPYVEVSSILGADSSYDSNRKVRRAAVWRSLGLFNDCHCQKLGTKVPHSSLDW